MSAKSELGFFGISPAENRFHATDLDVGPWWSDGKPPVAGIMAFNFL